MKCWPWGACVIYILEHKGEAGAWSGRKESLIQASTRAAHVPSFQWGHGVLPSPQMGPLPNAVLPGCGDGAEAELPRQPADSHMEEIRAEPRGAH